MSKFISACCCVIVGLEVLIGVPLAVLVAYAYGAASGGVQVAPADITATAYTSAPYVSPPKPCDGTLTWQPTPSTTCEPQMACLQPLNDPQSYSEPLAYAPSTLPGTSPAPMSMPTCNPYIVAPARVSVCPAPAVAHVPANPAAPAPTLPVAPSIEVPANTLATAQVSDEAAAQPEANPEPTTVATVEPPEPAADPGLLVSSDDLKKVLSDWQRLWLASGDMPALAAKICCSDDCPLTMAAACEAPAAEPPANSLRESLRQTVQQLYAQAARDEEAGDFQRADRLRELARGLRVEEVELSLRQQVAREPNELQTVEPPK